MIKIKIPEHTKYRFDFVTMADLAFNLLTFTMLSISTSEVNSIVVDLPQSNVTAKESVDLILTIDANKKLFLNKVEINITELATQLLSFTIEESNMLTIHADKNTPIDMIVKIGEVASAANMRIAIATAKDEN